MRTTAEERKGGDSPATNRRGSDVRQERGAAPIHPGGADLVKWIGRGAVAIAVAVAVAVTARCRRIRRWRLRRPEGELGIVNVARDEHDARGATRADERGKPARSEAHVASEAQSIDAGLKTIGPSSRRGACQNKAQCRAGRCGAARAASRRRSRRDEQAI
jgi:hypothetical protein